MTILVLVLWGTAMMFIARWLCGRWFNHLTLYSFVWTVSLLAFELRLIAYHAIVFEAWIYIFVAWVSIYLGTALVKLASPGPLIREFPDLNLRRLRDVILLLSAGGFVSSASLALRIVRALRASGIVAALVEQGNQIYAMRFQGEVSGIMYLDFLPYAGCVLAGIYAARLGRITLIAILPLVSMLVAGVVAMQRAGMIFGPVLFLFSYAFTPKTVKRRTTRTQKIAFGAVVLGAFILVTAARGGAQVYEGESPVLVRVGDSVSVLPSLYLYASAPIACFSDYLKDPVSDGKALWGRYMFASVYRFLSKFGMDTYVSYYQNFYYTPVPVNVGTYLREIHRDFGGTAIFIYPFFLGFIISILEARGPNWYSTVVLAFLYLVVFFSFNINFVGGGGWYFPLPICLLALAAVKVRCAPKLVVSGGPASAFST